jgi:hypothetical protein
LLVALFALAGAWFYANATSTERYVRVRQDIERGQVVSAEDFGPVELQLDGTIRAVRWERASTLIGRVAVVDLPSGTLATTGAFAEQTPIPAGSAVVSVEVDAGLVPAVRAGDRVQVLSLPIEGDRLDLELASVVADGVLVVEVGSDGGQRVVSMMVDADTARAVAVADALSRIRLIQVPEG